MPSTISRSRHPVLLHAAGSIDRLKVTALEYLHQDVHAPPDLFIHVYMPQSITAEYEHLPGDVYKVHICCIVLHVNRSASFLKKTIDKILCIRKAQMFVGAIKIWVESTLPTGREGGGGHVFLVSDLFSNCLSDNRNAKYCRLSQRCERKDAETVVKFENRVCEGRYIVYCPT